MRNNAAPWTLVRGGLILGLYAGSKLGLQFGFGCQVIPRSLRDSSLYCDEFNCF